MNELALFAGAGGGLLGSSLLGWRPICAVEVEPYCREIILRRQRDGVLEMFPIWSDIRTFDGRPWSGYVDVVTAGFPCQPFSVAGKGKGVDDERNLWPETIRVIREVGPRYALLENVPGLLAHPYFGTILGDLAESGYDTRWDCIPASAIGAPHQRDRLWIMAWYPDGNIQRKDAQVCTRQTAESGGICKDVAYAERAERWPHDEGRGHSSERKNRQRQATSGTRECRQVVADSKRERQQQQGRGEPESGRRTLDGGQEGFDWWAVEPRLGRVAHGVAHRMDRLKALGNGQVPGVVAAAWRLLNQ